MYCIMNLVQNKYNKQSVSAQACKSLCNSGFGGSGNQLLAAANANNAENAGVRCANTNNRGANTNANYGFPLLRLFGFYNTVIKPNHRNLATQKAHGGWHALTPIYVRAICAMLLAKEYEVWQRLVEGCMAASAKVLSWKRHKLLMQVSYGA